MRYIPLSAHERGYVGSQWNAKYLRAVQRMLVPTQGKGVCSRSFFEADFGLNADDFVRYLSMPERLIAARGKISTSSRGKTSETAEQYAVRKAGWEYKDGGSPDSKAHFQLFFKYYCKCSTDEVDEFIDLLKDYQILRFHEDGKIYRIKANQLYLPSRELRRYFESKPTTRFVDLDGYIELVGREQQQRGFH